MYEIKEEIAAMFIYLDIQEEFEKFKFCFSIAAHLHTPTTFPPLLPRPPSVVDCRGRLMISSSKGQGRAYKREEMLFFLHSLTKSDETGEFLGLILHQNIAGSSLYWEASVLLCWCCFLICLWLCNIMEPHSASDTFCVCRGR